MVKTIVHFHVHYHFYTNTNIMIYSRNSCTHLVITIIFLVITVIFLVITAIFLVITIIFLVITIIFLELILLARDSSPLAGISSLSARRPSLLNDDLTLYKHTEWCQSLSHDKKFQLGLVILFKISLHV